MNEKNNLVFLIETESNKKFGCFIDSEIYIDEYIEDKNAFLFSIDNNRMNKYDILINSDDCYGNYDDFERISLKEIK